MSYRMARLPMTLMRLKVTFAVLNLYNSHNSGNIACLHTNWKAHLACDLNFIVTYTEKVVIRRISERVQNRDVVTTGH